MAPQRLSMVLVDEKHFFLLLFVQTEVGNNGIILFYNYCSSQ
jgi:hypothetical protein